MQSGSDALSKGRKEKSSHGRSAQRAWEAHQNPPVRYSPWLLTRTAAERIVIATMERGARDGPLMLPLWALTPRAPGTYSHTFTKSPRSALLVPVRDKGRDWLQPARGSPRLFTGAFDLVVPAPPTSTPMPAPAIGPVGPGRSAPGKHIEMPHMQSLPTQEGVHLARNPTAIFKSHVPSVPAACRRLSHLAVISSLHRLRSLVRRPPTHTPCDPTPLNRPREPTLTPSGTPP